MREDRERLIRFLRDVSDVLEYVRDNGIYLLLPHLRSHFAAALELAQPAIDEAVAELQNQHLDDQLARVGLVGPSLDLKLAGFEYAMVMFLESLSLKWFKRLLKWINTLLGSLKSVIPGVEIVKELKESAEHGIEEGEEELKGVR